MEQKLEGDELELYRRVDEVLHYLWDPIGIAGTPEARDEYCGYLPQVYSFLTKGAEKASVRAYLLEIQQERMGLTFGENSAKRLDRTGEALFCWKEIISQRNVS